jgi:iron uptake system EfeUOB component EfeO/EfeM
MTALVVGASACAQPTAAPGPPIVDIAENTCGTGWHDPRPGDQTLEFRNTGADPVTVDLIDPDTGAVYAEVDNIGPNTSRSARVQVGGGRFAFRCAQEGSDNAMITGPVFTIAGAPAGPAIQPVTATDLYGPDQQYTAYVAAGLTRLAGDTDILRADIDRGDLVAARDAWLVAHLDYERLGAAYDAFDTFDNKIDGRADGLPGGTGDPGFTGLHRVEYGLWHGEPAATAAGPADQLAADVHDLVAAFGSMQVPIADLGLRTHEILENTLQFELTGSDDYGSGSTLATAAANVDGTRELLRVLDPVLRTRYPRLPQVIIWLDRFAAQLAGFDHDGRWTPVTELSPADRERLDGTLGQLLEYLAPIATLCTPRKTFQ